MNRQIELEVTRAELTALRTGVDHDDSKLTVSEALDSGRPAVLYCSLDQLSGWTYGAFCNLNEKAQEQFETFIGTYAGAAELSRSAAAATLAAKIHEIDGDRNGTEQVTLKQEVA
jgi:hypothetical protein